MDDRWIASGLLVDSEWTTGGWRVIYRWLASGRHVVGKLAVSKWSAGGHRVVGRFGSAYYMSKKMGNYFLDRQYNLRDPLRVFADDRR